MRNYIEDEDPSASALFGKQFLPDEKLLAKEIDETLALVGASPFDYAHIVYKLGVSHTNYLNHHAGARTSPYFMIWKDIESRWYAGATVRLSSFEPRDYSDVLYGLNNLQDSFPAAFKADFFRYALPKIDDFSCDNLASVGYSVGKLRLDLPPDFKAAYLKAVHKKLAGFNSRGITGILFTAEKLGFEFPPKFWIDYFDIHADRLGEFGNKDFSNSLRSINKLNKDRLRLLYSSEASQKYLSLYYESAAERMETLNARDLSTILHALVTMKILPPKAFFDAFYETTAEKLKTFDIENLAGITHSLAMLGIEIPGDYINEIAANAYLKLGHYNQRRPGDRAHLQTKIVWSLAIMSVFSPLSPEALSVAQKIIDQIDPTGMRDDDRNLCHQACMRLFKDKAGRFIPRVYRADFRRDETPNKVELLAHLTAAGFEQTNEGRLIDSIQIKNDYLFRLRDKGGNNVPVRIEFDEDYYFIKDFIGGHRRLKGSKRLVSALVAQEAPDSVYVRITPREATLLKSPERKHLLEEMKHQLPNLEKGLPHTLKFENQKIVFEPLFVAPLPGALGPLKPAEKTPRQQVLRPEYRA